MGDDSSCDERSSRPVKVVKYAQTIKQNHDASYLSVRSALALPCIPLCIGENGGGGAQSKPPFEYWGWPNEVRCWNKHMHCVNMPRRQGRDELITSL